jgi:hypothetical protein
MLSRDALPDDAADWRDIAISLPRLEDDSPHSCPVSVDDIFRHVQLESTDLDRADISRLTFRRTAKVGNAQTWLWSYTESDGEVSFVSFRQNADGSIMLGLASPNGLSEDQFLLADYYDEIYWS